MRRCLLALIVLALAALWGASAAQALSTATGEFRVKRTSFSRSGSSKKGYPSGPSELWALEKGCKPGKQCLFRQFGRGLGRLAPPIYGLNLKRNAFRKPFKHSFDHDCYLNEDMAGTFNLHVTKVKGSRVVRFAASLSWTWRKEVQPPDPEPQPDPEPSPTPEPEDASELAVAATVIRGSAQATYTGTYLGPVPKDRSGRAPVEPWEDICRSA